MSSDKLLTISIPTWNRSALLKGLLTDLTEEIVGNKLIDDIDILISNNNSDDNTDDIVNDFKGRFSFINYNRNSSNIGAKGNVLKSMYLASGKFVIFIGDDDKVRSGALSQLVSELKSKADAGVLIDTALSKFGAKSGPVKLEQLLEKYYWFIGNAGFFIIRSEYIRLYIDRYGYDFFNECWPQTQIIILSLFEQKDVVCYLVTVGIHTTSAHTEVTLYNSFYLWRTCYYELTLSINAIALQTNVSCVEAAKKYLKNSLPQQLLNILQCGLFVDSSKERRRTGRHVFQNLNLYSFYEKAVLSVIVIALFLPVFISRPFANLFIYLMNGKKGLRKKNEFVLKELVKRRALDRQKSGSIRALEFEKS